MLLTALVQREFNGDVKFGRRRRIGTPTAKANIDGGSAMAEPVGGGADEFRVKDLWIKVTPGSATEQGGQQDWCGFCTTMDTCGGCTFCTAPSVTVLCDPQTLPAEDAALEELRVQLRGQLAALEQGEQEAGVTTGVVASGVAKFKSRLYQALSDIEERRAATKGD